MEEDTATSNKRFRDEDVEESPEAKRIRADLLLDILDEDDDEDSEADGGRDAAVQDLASVMRSLEEEIALPASGEDLDGLRQPDLGYLLEASDDELGLPPTLPCSSDEAEKELLGGSEEAEEVVGGGEAVGFGQIWGFDDEIQFGCYDGLDFGFRPEEREIVGGEDGLVFDGGLFDYADGLCGPADFSDSAWRSESLPAV